MKTVKSILVTISFFLSTVLPTMPLAMPTTQSAVSLKSIISKVCINNWGITIALKQDQEKYIENAPRSINDSNTIRTAEGHNYAYANLGNGVLCYKRIADNCYTNAVYFFDATRVLARYSNAYKHTNCAYAPGL